MINTYFCLMESKKIKELSTEHKIRDAAQKLFMKKGFSNTKTRDIAEASGINLALMNYYFRSKKKLFELIMLDNLKTFLKSLIEIMHHDNALEDKIYEFADRYITLITENPDLPIFILSELRFNQSDFLKKTNFNELLKNTVFLKQFQQAVIEKKIKPVHPIQFLMSLAGMTIFPFIGKPVFQVIGKLNNKQFQEMMQERRKLIPELLLNGILISKK